METLTKIRLAKKEKHTVDIIASHMVCNIAQLVLKSYSKLNKKRLLGKFYVLSVNGIVLRSFRTEIIAISIFNIIRKLLEEIENVTVKKCFDKYIG